MDLPRLLAEVRAALGGIGAGLKVAVMGCIVNGPGEAADAHVAVCAGKGTGQIYVDGKRVATVPENRIAAELVQRVKDYSPAAGPAD